MNCRLCTVDASRNEAWLPGTDLNPPVGGLTATKQGGMDPSPTRRGLELSLPSDRLCAGGAGLVVDEDPGPGPPFGGESQATPRIIVLGQPAVKVGCLTDVDPVA